MPVTWTSTPTQVAVLLFTSGTTGEPKAAVLRHRHLASYVISTVEFMGADEDEAALVSVPPYHVAGISAVLIVDLRRAPASCYLPAVRRRRRGCDLAEDEAVTHAMVVPTMLGRILDVLERHGDARCRPCATSPTAAGGCRCPSSSGRWGCCRTSTSSTPTGSPRPARRSPCSAPTTTARRSPATTRRCGPARLGRPAAADARARDPRPDGAPVLAPASTGEICVRGEQVAGEYLGRSGAAPTTAGSRPTTPASSTRTASSSSRAASTTSSSGAARTSRRARSRTCSSPTPPSPRPRVVGVPDERVGREVVAAAVVLEPGRDRPPRPSCRTGCASACARLEDPAA